jgi:hypothetical protein
VRAAAAALRAPERLPAALPPPGGGASDASDGAEPGRRLSVMAWTAAANSCSGRGETG